MPSPTTLQDSKPRHLGRGIFTGIRIIEICILIGIGLGACRGVLYITEVAPWQSLGKPPQPATKILFAEVSTVFVQTITGQTYQCCWNLADVPTAATNRNCDPYRTDPQPPPVPPPPLPAPAIDRQQIAKILESCEHVVYAVLDDGSVWRWQYSMSLEKMLMPFINGAMGLVAGLIVGLAAAVIFWSITLIRRISRR